MLPSLSPKSKLAPRLTCAPSNLDNLLDFNFCCFKLLKFTYSILCTKHIENSRAREDPHQQVGNVEVVPSNGPMKRAVKEDLEGEF